MDNESQAEPTPEQIAEALAAEEAEKAAQHAKMAEQAEMTRQAVAYQIAEQDREQRARDEVAAAEQARVDAVLADSPSLTPDEARAWLAMEAKRLALAARPCCPCRDHAHREVVRLGQNLGRCTCSHHDGVAK
jgi:hypothetical protein